MAKTTQDAMMQDAQEYSSAFDEAPAPAAEKSEDESFGITPPPAPVDTATEPGVSPSADASDTAPVADAAAAQAGAPAEGASEVAAEPVAVIVATADDKAFDPAKEEHRLKSWEGRLKKLEAQLKAKATETGQPAEEVAADTIEQVADDAEDAGKTELADAAENAAEQVEAGTITAAEAMKMLAEDFGSSFVDMIVAIAKEAAAGLADEKIGSVRKDVDDVISHITNERERAHFEAIAAKHPDFNDIANSEAFKAWTAEDPQRADIAATGSASAINAMLDEYKAQSAPAQETAPAETMVAENKPAPMPASPDDDDALDAAEGVRSGGGLRLPEEPVAAGDYESAWNES